jgi:hypothetical protein
LNGTATVAITGSVARGDAGQGSDLDLWVLGPHRDRQHRLFDGVPVTLLRQRPRDALGLDTLCHFEVADALVLSDPRGHFRRVQQSATRRAAEVREAVLESTWEGLRAELLLVDDASHWQRTLALRQFAFRLASTWLYLRHGWRVPRLRTLHAHLPARQRKLLDAILGLPVSAAAVRAALKGLAPAYRAAHRLAPASRLLPEAPPRELATRCAAKEWAEALLLARRDLRRELLPPLLTELDFRDVTQLAPLPQGKLVLEAVRRCEGLAPGTHSGKLRRQVGKLAVGLDLAKRLPPDVRRAISP